VPRRIALWIDVAVKAALIGLLLLAVLRPDLPQFEGKAMTGRALTSAATTEPVSPRARSPSVTS
jgi:hypothetical protein